jgi:hypothetical protein
MVQEPARASTAQELNGEKRSDADTNREGHGTLPKSLSLASSDLQPQQPVGR